MESFEGGSGRGKSGILFKLLSEAFWEASASARLCAEAPAPRAKGRKYLSCMARYNGVLYSKGDEKKWVSQEDFRNERKKREAVS